MIKKYPNDQDPANYGKIAVKPMITMVHISIICEYDDDKENDRKATYY